MSWQIVQEIGRIKRKREEKMHKKGARELKNKFRMQRVPPPAAGQDTCKCNPSHSHSHSRSHSRSLALAFTFTLTLTLSLPLTLTLTLTLTLSHIHTHTHPQHTRNNRYWLCILAGTWRIGYVDWTWHGSCAKGTEGQDHKKERNARGRRRPFAK